MFEFDLCSYKKAHHDVCAFPYVCLPNTSRQSKQIYLNYIVNELLFTSIETTKKEINLLESNKLGKTLIHILNFFYQIFLFIKKNKN